MNSKYRMVKPLADTPPIYYKNTDPSPPAGAVEVQMTSYPDAASNVTPALLAWLFLTTNPIWPGDIDEDGEIKNPDTGTTEDIAMQLGLTKGCLQFIFKMAKAKPNLFLEVCNEFQMIIKAYEDPAGAWRFPCALTGAEILHLASVDKVIRARP